MSRIVFTQGGIGGAGKTSFMTMLVEWYRAQNIAVAVLDMDAESPYSLAHFFGGVQRVSMHRPEGLDPALNALSDEVAVAVADLPSGTKEATREWFDTMFPSAQENGLVFTAIGLVTPDPASVCSVLGWASALQDRVQYLMVKNALRQPADFDYWIGAPMVKKFRDLLDVKVIEMEYRRPEVESLARWSGYTLQEVAEGKAPVPGLQRKKRRRWAQGYRQRLFAELDRVRQILT